MNINKEIGAKIKARREDLKMSQRALAEKMGYSNHSTVARIENGLVDIPQSRIVQFSEVLGVSTSYLMGWEKVQKNNDAITDIIIKMRTDEDFMLLVRDLSLLSEDKLTAVKSMVSALLK